MNYLLENSLLSTKQYGFVKGRSTMLQLLHIIMVDKWTECLFEKAFDKVPHKRLISKLHAYGLRDSIIRWIKKISKR